ncbi:MAG: hypothetical protein ACK40G_00385 [Cytophagaceae bacterium]
MKTLVYNPSKLEVDLINIIKDLQPTIEKQLKPASIIKVEHHLQEDNPLIVYKLIDEDGDKHEIVLKVIQRQDDFCE